MTTEIPYTGEFTFWFPVWLIADKDKFKALPFPEYLLVMGLAEIGDYIPVFTDKDLAERFIDGRALSAASVPVPVQTPKHLHDTLQLFEIMGVKNVGVDPSGGEITQGRFCSLTFFLEHLARQLPPPSPP